MKRTLIQPLSIPWAVQVELPHHGLAYFEPNVFNLVPQNDRQFERVIVDGMEFSLDALLMAQRDTR